MSKVVDIRCRRYEIYAIKSFHWKDNPVTNESSNEKQYACYQCNFRSISIPGLKIHQYRNHKEEVEMEKKAKKPKLVIKFPCTFLLSIVTIHKGCGRVGHARCEKNREAE